MTESQGSFRQNMVLYSALLANVRIAIAKIVASAISGSSLILTELAL